MPEFYKEINLSALSDKNLCNHILNEYLFLTKLAVLIFHKQRKRSENGLSRRSEASKSEDEEQLKTEVCFVKVLLHCTWQKIVGNTNYCFKFL